MKRKCGIEIKIDFQINWNWEKPSEVGITKACKGSQNKCTVLIFVVGIIKFRIKRLLILILTNKQTKIDKIKREKWMNMGLIVLYF